MENNDSKKQRNKWIALINIPIQMGVIIFVFAYAGQWLDDKYPNPSIAYTKVITLVGVFLALYNVYRQVNELGKTEDK
ncbi:AtpZ/AtpI family protein [Flavobacterium sp. SM2513]|uniref:AtpZ/AtpI family protein n=1 Tax=Flavobacterium sp. SM2513 TaxID=3424766 RepID=UPI003D7F4732